MDTFFRQLRIRHIAEESYKIMPAEDKAFYQAYADGINDFVVGINLLSQSPTARLLPPEFLAFGITKDNWRPWHPVDSICVLKLMNFHLSWNWMNDLTRESIKKIHPELNEMVEEIAPFHAGNLHKMTTVLDDADLKEWNQWSDKTLLERYQEAFEHAKAAEPKFEFQGAGAGAKMISDLGFENPVFGEDNMASNNWVIHGSLTEDGAPLLANDPHLSTSLPAAWVLNELVWDERYAIGATMVGLPGVNLGRTPDFSWGITTPIGDNSDLWEEKLNEDETQYFVDGEWKDLKIVTEELKVKGKEPVKLDIKFTHRGPICDFDTLAFNAALLFGGKVPIMKNPPKYSLGWGSGVIGDTTP
jgi:penicillin G amidase